MSRLSIFGPFFPIVLAAFFAVLGLREGQRAKVQVLRLREMEFREIETDLDTLQLRADVDQLRPPRPKSSPAPSWRATAVFAGAERDDDDDDDGLAWGEIISYEPSPDLGDVPVAVPIPSAPPVEAARA